MLGCIADDFTGATDLAVLLRRRGLNVALVTGLPARLDTGAVDAVVVALKSRSIAPLDAIDMSLEALRFLSAHGADKIYFKYCSTFDSTDCGNIGPVVDALMAALAVSRTAAVPAFPENGRRVFMGHLFVGGVPLSESALSRHPITPMTDSNVVRLLGRQRRGPVALVDFTQIAQGPAAVRAAYDATRQDCAIVCDALTDADIETLADALAQERLLTGGSAFGAAVGARQAVARPAQGSKPVVSLNAPTTICFSGSASEVTRCQLDRAIQNGFVGLEIDISALCEIEEQARRLSQAIERHADRPVIIHTPPYATGQSDAGLGCRIDELFARLTERLRARGYNSFVVAGGETSGAVVGALDDKVFDVGPEIAPGVPWIVGASSMVALKSGNFGGPDFFGDALALMPVQGGLHD